MATINVANPGSGNDIQPNLAAAIALAANRGDKIQLPAGTFKFNNFINVNTGKTFELAGAGVGGVGNTVLERDNATSEATLEGWEYMLRFNPLTDKPSGIKIHGITFKSQTPSETDGGDGGSMALDYGIIMFRAVDFVIYDCNFENFGNSGVEVNHRDDISRGLIYNCNFIHNAKGATGQGYGYGVSVYGENARYILNPNFGSDNFIFVESCFFSRHRHAIASGGCSMYVMRNCTIERMEYGENYETQAIDMHDGNGPGIAGVNKYGSRASEIYNNTIVLTTYIDGTTIDGSKSDSFAPETAIKIRGGAALIYGNTISGVRFGIGIDPIAPTSTKYPWWCQSGFISGQIYGSDHSGTDSRKGDGDVYYWGNTFTPMTFTPSASSTLAYTFQGGGPEVLLKTGRDYSTENQITAGKYKPLPFPHYLRSL